LRPRLVRGFSRASGADSRAFPEIGFYRQEDARRQQCGSAAADRAGHGRYNPSARQVFDAGNPSIRATMEVWPGLLALAVLLTLAEPVLRQWKGVLEALHLREQAA
jgi:hypothetical protein